MRQFRVGLIGAGAAARVHHLPGWRNIAGAEVAAVADINRQAAEALAREHGIPGVYGDYHELLGLDLDAVDVCTPNRAHLPIVLAALEAGKHVLCEKPLAVGAAEVRRMGETADRLGLTLMTGQPQRYTPSARALKGWVDAGHLGKVYHARVRALRRGNVPLSPGLIDIGQSGGGPCLDIGVHALDLCLWLMGFPEPVRVSGATRVNFAKGHAIPGYWGEWNRERFSVEDFAAGFVHFTDGATLMLEAAWLGHQEEAEEQSCELLGLKGSARWPAAEIASLQGGSFLKGSLTYPRRLDPPQNASIRAFHECVTRGLPSPVHWRESLKVIAVLEAVYRSGEAGCEVRLDGECRPPGDVADALRAAGETARG